uniref:DUF1501 domain-containing protein n=1 Tax=Pseudictyota dubia TaxID=2749911 RepID=A0A7R9ZFB4_9STRA
MPNQYDGERVTYSTAQGRCLADTDLCDYDEIDASIPKVKTGYHWTTDNCFIDVKVDRDGNIAIVYRMNAYTSKVMHVDDGTLNYFPVAWESGFPGENGAACPASCTTLSDGACKCSTSVQEAVVYDNVMPPSKEDALSKLHIGSMNVSSYDAGDFSSEYDAATMITAHKKNAGIDADTVFELVDDTGRTHFLRNMRSTVTLQGTGFSFRNSPHFVSLIPTETDVRDAEYETEAILDHYFYNDNTAPFLAIRFIQRFGISNPTPAFVLAVATAFRSGSFEAGGKTFGDGKYGNLQATAAAVLLHPEARSVVLDADPSHGSLREPLVKVISLMRNLNFTKYNENELVRFDHVGLENTIGQMAHMYPTVFSFFLPEYIPAGRLTPGSLVAPEAMMVDMPKQVAMLNGIFSLVKYGFEDKNGGFGENGNKIGELGYASGLDTAGLVDDLATLLTAGRLSADNRAIVVNAVDHTITNNVGFTLAEQGLELAQQLIATTAEFHSTNIVKKGGPARAVDDSSGSQSLSPYKAVVFLMLAGGCDSYQMLVPHTCAVVGNETSLHDQYVEIREDVALEKESLLLINATDSDQYCDWFGLHPQLQNLQQLYNEKDALLVANAGVLTKPTDKDNYKEDTVTNLFAHNTMQREGKRVDPYEAFPGSGVMGRVTDVLHRNNYKTSAISIDSNSIALVGKPGESPTPFIISKNGITPFNEDPTTNGTFMQEQIDALNSATTADSGFMAETWSSNLFSSLKSNEALDAALASAVTNVTFPSTKLGDSLEMVARLIQTASTREVDRDFFYVQMGGYDTHSEVLANLQNRFVELDGAIGAFSNELKAQGVWDDVVVVEVSDFARTLTPNSGKGTDHAWGGNYFMLGGGLKGGQILGKYPEHITSDAPLNVGRGRIIPTTSWDHLWNGVAEWVGVDLAQDALEVCPNGGNFNDLFTAADLFDPAGGARMRERFLRN